MVDARSCVSRRQSSFVPWKRFPASWHPSFVRESFDFLEFLIADGHRGQERVNLCRSPSAVRSNRPTRRVESWKNTGTAKQRPILSGAISGNQGLKCRYLAEILDALPMAFTVDSAI